ncbi:MAG: sugar phosphate nucleotidyltransferase [Pyrinomonadaceae bacterium]
MKAMILAAGFGTRLFPLTIDRTKPAIPFLGRPVVQYVAEYLRAFGITDLVVNLHHQPDSVIRALGDGSDYGVRIQYSIEQPEILGTSGALDHARHLLGDEAFVIVNGKIVTDIDIAAAIKTHRDTGAVATMVLKPNAARERFTEVVVEDGLVRGFGGYPEPAAAAGDPVPMMFTGIHILEPSVFEYIPRGVYSDIVPTFYQPAIERGETIAAHIADGRWFELSTLRRYLDISLAMMTAGCSVQIGRGSVVADRADVTDSVIWDDVVVEPGATLRRAVIADGVRVRSGQRFENAVVVRAASVRACSSIPEKAPAGFFDGENYVVPLADQ